MGGGVGLAALSGQRKVGFRLSQIIRGNLEHCGDKL